LSVKNPWLIQRARIAKSPRPGATLSESVRLDYMGSSEFEFGALPTSHRSMHAASFRFDIRPLDIHNFKGEPLLVAGALNVEDVPSYQEIWKTLTSAEYSERSTKERVEVWPHMVPPPAKIAMPSHMKRSSRLEKDRYIEEQKTPRTDFWWDLDNGLMLSFNADYMRKLPGYLEASWAIMDGLTPTGLEKRVYSISDVSPERAGDVVALAMRR
jgi:hypothetical protein